MEKKIFHVVIGGSLCFLCHKLYSSNCSNERNATALQPRFAMNQFWCPDPVKPSDGISSHVLCEQDEKHLWARSCAVLTVRVITMGLNPSPIDTSWIFLLQQWNTFTFKFSGKSRVLLPVFWAKWCMGLAPGSH